MTSPVPRGGFDPRRALSRPVVTYFDNRFREVHDRIRELSEQVDEQLQQLYGRVATEVETISEMTLGMQRFFDVSARQVDDLLDRLSSLELAPPEGVRVEGVRDDGVQVVESAFALSAAGLRPGLRILSVASADTDAGLPMALAALGCPVTVVDGPIDTWSVGDTLFDRVLWLPSRLDRNMLDLLAKGLDVGGELVASVRNHPHLEPQVDGASPALDDWAVLERRVVVQRGGSSWEPLPDGADVPSAPAARTVTLLRATPRT